MSNRKADSPVWVHHTWSTDTQTAELQKANLCLIPTRKGVEYKSPNRMVNALRAGCFVIADLHPAYEEFRDFVWTGNVITGIKWAQHFKQDLDAIVGEGQKYIRKFAPSEIGKQWSQLLTSLCD